MNRNSRQWYKGDRKPLRGDSGGELAVGHWTSLIIGIVVLLYVVANLFPSITTSSSEYANVSPVFGGLIETLLPILIGAGLLLYFVSGLVPRG